MKVDLFQHFGPDYPAAVTCDGHRLTLAKQKRFSRIYQNASGSIRAEISRFMDGSAHISFEDLRAGWARWTSDDRIDFCSNCSWLGTQPDFPSVLRFILEHGAPEEWSMIALDVAGCLPQEESFELLRRALASVPLRDSANLAQGLAATKHPAAIDILLHRLDEIWAHPQVWDDHKSFNSIASMATAAIRDLLGRFEMPPERFSEQAQQLSNHVCKHNRETTRRFLGKYYPSLPPPESAAGRIT